MSESFDGGGLPMLIFGCARSQRQAHVSVIRHHVPKLRGCRTRSTIIRDGLDAFADSVPFIHDYSKCLSGMIRSRDSQLLLAEAL